MVRHYRSPDAEIREEAIPIVKLDELLPATFPEAGVFILKLDCEGHDHEVLHGAREFLAANKARWVTPVAQLSDKTQSFSLKIPCGTAANYPVPRSLLMIDNLGDE